MDLKKLLNEEQYKAATKIDGPILILAGAGSGKTRVLTYRIAHMVKDLEIYPSQILAITFTNKAAKEMKDRVKALIGGNEIDNMWISTFHSCCVRILRREIDKIGYNKNFTIYDSDDQKVLMRECIKQVGINEKDITEKEIISKIGSAKDGLVSANQYKNQNSGNFKLNKIADVYLLYQKKLKENNALDFDDLIFKTVELFKKAPDVLAFYQRKFRYIMIDEYQDTNKSQYEFARLLASANKNLCVVGDDDQCIYGWRGADIRNILNFEKDYRNAVIIKLEENYRSKGNILKAANGVIKNNPHEHLKSLRTRSEDGAKIKVYRGETDLDEASFAAFKINKEVKEEKRSFKDFAILYRTNAQSRVFEDIFIKRNIPYRIIGGLKFYDRKEIKDIMSYLKLIGNPLDNISLKRIINVPKRSIGQTTLGRLQQFADEVEECLYDALLDIENIPGIPKRAISSIKEFTGMINSFIRRKDEINVSVLIKEILEQTGYLNELKASDDIQDKARIENIEELVNAAVDFEENSDDKTLAAFLEKTALVADVDNYNEDADTVVMMTVHSAKGLEFPVVFMAGMENGIFPGMASFNSEYEMEESRRLAYVGITRAKEKLYMTSAKLRRVFGKTQAFEESDFINEIDENLKEYVTLDGEGRRKKDTTGLFSTISSDIPPKNAMFSNFMSKSGFNANEMIKKSVKEEKKSIKTLNEEDAVKGAKVVHMKFGKGTIITTSRADGHINLTIAFENMGIKNLRLDMAPLQLL
ncbi:DNA helicase-2/ATP-dependent DNA helicase PcrA [Clostridium acetobutylicum]|uniref:ATP-dependent DNA helicase n=1 Tax=Clostridium acetobutylicum (strain ATCC 824 / DSM 792 / JCM 1419 / IAM 19013 / LMG 5710 / NBRC 13948 / NRRL B-527 / VKM B-1787 / 2291 / W) TaxID=272562 RepID=Q97FQ4_CLOAB|nr:MULTISPECIES: DNA helicase PcrA [Clostridium]AAK80621.1 ATP-dependent superfamily I DNA helicase, PCRA [Clostridium acetobutylicum ATCC 824]ADZ21720.1 ATP-dependent superfamily I DNA helicase, PCRA [Clostridium acetobutylicum EA 2018]AEI33484.1 ATP-dependent DNA helicase [Clostridium acetobutylicum DSM 1731]AWV78962.1 DNA helicase PcrA [Clostridium acetobutylicum]MBC2395202.1 DNA helicase PcrA [Clostridium acetobutylicum]